MIPTVFDLRPMITPLVSSKCSIYNLMWPWHCLSFFDLRPMITPLASSNWSKLYIEQFDDTNGLIRGRKSKMDRQCHGHIKLYIEQFDDTNGVIIGRKSKKITPLVSSNCSIYNLMWPWHCLSFFDLGPLITPLVSSNCSIYNLVWPWNCLSLEGQTMPPSH
jgi:hypothetical protein